MKQVLPNVLLITPQRSRKICLDIHDRTLLSSILTLLFSKIMFIFTKSSYLKAKYFFDK